MLALVEFQMMNKMKGNICRLEYIPNLAASFILAKCKEEGIKIKLIKGQTRYFKDIFINEYKELLELLNDLNSEDIRCIKLNGLNNLKFIFNLFRKDEDFFKQSLRKFYNVATAKFEADYVNKKEVLELLRIKNGIFQLYDFYYILRKERNLSIINNLVESIKNVKPDIVAFSLKSNYDYDHIEYVSDFVREAINRVKKELDIPVIAVGPALPTLNNIEQHIFDNFHLDYYLFDDGKETVSQLITNLEQNSSLKDVSNLCYKKGNKIIKNSIKKSVNYDSLPIPDFSDFDLDLYFFPERILPIDIASVCYWKKCAFCSEVPDIDYNILSKERFLEIIRRYLEKYNVHFVEIQSTCASAEQLKSYAEILKKNNIKDIYFSTLARFEEKYVDRALAKDFYEGGMRHFMWGLESGSQKILNRMNKGINLKTVEKILKNFHKNGLTNMCYVMIGFPGETREDFNATLNFLQKNHELIDGTIITPFNLFKNSLIMKNPPNFFIEKVFRNENNPATLKFNLSHGLSQKESMEILRNIRKKLESSELKISNKNMDPLDQFYLDEIGGNDSLHHTLFYQAVKPDLERLKHGR